MHAARHQVVARPFRRRLGQHRRLDLEEALLVEVPAGSPSSRGGAASMLCCMPRPAQVEVAIAAAACPPTTGDSSAIGNGGVFASLSSADLARRDLDLAGLHLRVDRLGRAQLDAARARRRRTPGAAAWPSASSASSSRTTTCVMPWRSRMSRNISAAEIADAVHPAEQHDVLADVVGASARRRCGCARG